MSARRPPSRSILGLIILATAGLFVPLHIHHPLWMLAFLVLTAVTFSLFGFIIGIWADGFEQLQMIPMLVVTPLTFLGGSFYSINMLPSGWRTITLLNPVVYLISRLPLELLRNRRCQHLAECHGHARLLRRLLGHHLVDIQNGIPPEELRRRPSPPVHKPLIAAPLEPSPKSGHSACGERGGGIKAWRPDVNAFLSRRACRFFADHRRRPGQGRHHRRQGQRSR